jgi:hypothetical protein
MRRPRSFEETRLRKQSDGKSMWWDPMLANMTPEQVEEYVKNGAPPIKESKLQLR